MTEVKFEPVYSGPEAPTTETNTTTTEQRPEWLPQEFKTVEDFSKSYKELRADHTRKSQELANLKKVQVLDNGMPVEQTAQEEKPEAAAPAEKASEATTEGETTTEETTSTDEAAKALSDRNLNIVEFQQEFTTNGKLTDESYAKLEAAGIPKDIADRYIEGQKAIADRTVQDLLSTVGGQEQFTKIAQWAKQNMPEAAVKAFDSVMEAGDVEACRLALNGLKAQYTAAMGGSEPSLVSGANAKASGDVFTSNQQIVEAMSDPRYKKDPGFRKQVQDKLARS